DRLVAMGVELADDVADHARRFLIALAGVEPEQAHGMQDAPMHRLETVACIGEGALGDGRQRVGEVAFFQRLAQVNDVLAAVGRGHSVSASHGRSWGSVESLPHYNVVDAVARGATGRTG